MESKYFPIEIEGKWSKVWSDRTLDKPNSDHHFSQIIPPPNVTGTLHMGHSFQSVSYTHLTLPTICSV